MSAHSEKKEHGDSLAVIGKGSSSKIRIDRGEMTSLLAAMVKIPSVNPPGEEGRVASLIHDWSLKNGLQAELDEQIKGRSNVYVSLRGSGSGPTLLLNGHLDVVPEGSGWTHAPFGGEVESGRLFGRGAADMKGGIAAALVAAGALADSEIKLTGRLLIHGVMDEEGAGKGTVRAITRGLTAEHAIVCEPTSLAVMTASKGDLDLEITVSGRAAHSSAPQEGLNAIYKMRKVIEGIERYSKNLKRTHPLLGHPTASVDIIEGGESWWIIPESCRIVVDRRMLPGETFDSVLREMGEMVEDLKKRDPELVINFRSLQRDEPAEISWSEDIVKVMQQAHQSVTGERRQPAGISGTTDARFLINQAKIPTVIYGPGNLSQAHKPDEYVSLSEVYTAARVYADAAVRLLS
jgi:acetylornithine deacetylase/succinyl-diaminopimelate desuccinylase family protein